MMPKGCTGNRAKNIYIIIFHQSVCASRVSEGAAEKN